jgi:hypothetical protein
MITNHVYLLIKDIDFKDTFGLRVAKGFEYIVQDFLLWLCSLAKVDTKMLDDGLIRLLSIEKFSMFSDFYLDYFFVKLIVFREYDKLNWFLNYYPFISFGQYGFRPSNVEVGVGKYCGKFIMHCANVPLQMHVLKNVCDLKQRDLYRKILLEITKKRYYACAILWRSKRAGQKLLLPEIWTMIAKCVIFDTNYYLLNSDAKKDLSKAYNRLFKEYWDIQNNQPFCE